MKKNFATMQQLHHLKHIWIVDQQHELHCGKAIYLNRKMTTLTALH